MQKFQESYINMIQLDFDLKEKIVNDKIIPCIVERGLNKHLD